MRFMLKVLTVFVICGAIFMYYLGSLRWERNDDLRKAKRRSLIFGLGSFAVLAISFCTGLSVAGTPPAQRQIEADKRRVEDLRQLAREVYSWHNRLSNLHQTEALPLRLSDVVGAHDNRAADPQTKRPYEYVAGAGIRYQLCAVFASRNADQVPTPRFWRHEPGRSCFTFDAAQAPPWQ